MKKHWKKILLAFTVVVLAAAGYLLYIFKFKEYDVADEEVAEITKETYKIEMPDGSVIEFDEEGNMVESNGSKVSSDDLVASAAERDDTDASTSSTDGSSNDSNSSQDSDGNDSTSTNGSDWNSSSNGSSSNGGSSNGNSGGGTSGNTGNTPSQEVTVAAIKEKYMPVMNQLSAQANSRIDALVGRAVSEYQTKVANGESVNYGYFYNKYMSAASELEGRTDVVFYQMVSVVEKELEKNGFSKSHAKSFISEYEASKEARRKALLDKAMNR